jgi:hypothetical protein
MARMPAVPLRKDLPCVGNDAEDDVEDALTGTELAVGQDLVPNDGLEHRDDLAHHRDDVDEHLQGRPERGADGGVHHRDRVVAWIGAQEALLPLHEDLGIDLLDHPFLGR